jgi:hypothetical protein
MTADVFVRYAHKDRDEVLAWVQRLQEAGASLWIDEADIDAAHPSLDRHARGLREEWLPQQEQALAEERAHDRAAAAESLEPARGFIDLLDAEIAGRT